MYPNFCQSNRCGRRIREVEASSRELRGLRMPGKPPTAPYRIYFVQHQSDVDNVADETGSACDRTCGALCRVKSKRTADPVERRPAACGRGESCRGALISPD
jgi:hypothetical protein